MAQMTNPQSARDLARENAHSLIVDLVRQRDDLTRVLQQRDALTMAIDGLVIVYGKPESVAEALSSPVIREHPKAADAVKAKLAPKGMLTDTIMKVALESQQTSIQLTDRVDKTMTQYGYPVTRQAIQQAIYKLTQDGRLHKGNDLKMRVIENGKVQGLPPMPPGPFTSFADGRSSE